MEAIISLRKKSFVAPSQSMLSNGNQIKSDKILEKSNGNLKAFQILSESFDINFLNRKLTKSFNEYNHDETVNWKSLLEIIEINKITNFQLMKHPFVKFNSVSTKAHSRRMDKKRLENSLKLVPYEQMLKKSFKGIRKHPKSRKGLEAIDDKVIFDELPSKKKKLVKFKAKSLTDEIKKVPKDTLCKSQSDNLLTEYPTNYHSETVTNCINNHLNNVGMISSNRDAIINTLPLMSIKTLSQKTIPYNFNISKEKVEVDQTNSEEVNQDPADSKHSDSLVKMKNNYNFYFSIKTNTKFPKIIQKNQSNKSFYHRTYDKSKQKKSIFHLANHETSSNNFTACLFVNDIKPKMFNTLHYPPSTRHCNSPISEVSDESENNHFTFPPIK